MIMLDKHIIQTRGFHNTTDENGNITGFQFRLRTKYYKGLWLSEVRIGDLKIDDRIYPREKQIWEINGVEYTPDEMLEIGDSLDSTYWKVSDAAIIKVKEQGGLSQGYHTLSIKFGWTSTLTAGPMVDPELGHTIMTRNNERTLQIV